MKEVKLRESLRKDALSVAHGLYHMNASSAIGYLFNRTLIGKQVVSTGMFCHSKNEIDSSQWDYYYDYETKKFYSVEG